MSNYPLQWQQIQSAIKQQRLAQAMLLVGPLHCQLPSFATQIMQLILCKEKKDNPCLNCVDCRMVDRMGHPDVEWVTPDKSGGPVKIDQIRDLQNSAYLTPQRSSYRIIAIESADRMNNAAANALLKILEEPAPHTIFILIAQQLSTVIPTILSRCQKIPFSAADDALGKNLLCLGEQYPKDSERAVLTQQAEIILEGLTALLERREHPCILAAQWSQFELSTLLWFLYLIYSQSLFILNNIPIKSGPAVDKQIHLSTLMNPHIIFTQIDKISTLLRKISHNINVNQTLALEDLLFSLAPSC